MPNERYDLAGSVGDSISNFGKGFIGNIKGAYKWVMTEWLKLLVLVASATQTYALISFLAPAWAFWLPTVGVLLMEGTIPLWQKREADADAADGNVADKEKNAQERIANIMVWVCIFMSAITMVGGAFVEVSQGQLAEVLKPNPAVTATLGWSSLIGIFLLGTAHLISDWRYRRADPMVVLEREHRAKEREVERRIRRVELTGKRRIAESEIRKVRQLYHKNSTKLGQTRAEKRFSTEEENE